jgi:hypothetical protein
VKGFFEMQRQESSVEWVEREKVSYYWVFGFFYGLVLGWFALGRIVNWGWWPEGALEGVAVVGIYVFPLVALFASVILTVWGICLIVLGWRYASNVFTLTIATFVSALPITLLAVGYVYFQSF